MWDLSIDSGYRTKELALVEYSLNHDLDSCEGPNNSNAGSDDA